MADFIEREIFKDAYWKRPESENKGDDKSADVYQAVGYALTMWELMEEALAELYLPLVGAAKTSNNPVRRAYGAIESNSGRRKAIEAAAEAFFGAYWDDTLVRRAFLYLTNTIGNASKRRDDIAHGIVLGQVLDNVKYGHFLFPPDYNTLRTNLYVDPDSGDPLSHTMTKYRFTGAQIRALGLKFHQLQDTVREYAGLMSKDGEMIIFVRAVKGLTVFDS